MPVRDDLDEVVNLAGEVAALRQRLAQLDAERVTIEAQLADFVNRIAAAAVAVSTPPLAEPPAAPSNEWKDPMPLSAAVLYVLRRSREKVFTAPEIAGILTMTDSVGAIRTHLWRLAKKGVVTRFSFGKYKAA
jgi:hypothetical protein